MNTGVREGETLAGKYLVEHVLGRGGMGVVVRAVHVQLGHHMAIKLLLPEACHPEAVSRFLREARAAVQIKSEHVARVSDVGTLETGEPYMVMEYLNGCDLAKLRESRRGPLGIEEVLDYVLQACEAIAEAHAAGIVHRDLKPSNLFLTQHADGSPLVKVLDFGISKARAAAELEGAREPRRQADPAALPAHRAQADPVARREREAPPGSAAQPVVQEGPAKEARADRRAQAARRGAAASQAQPEAQPAATVASEAPAGARRAASAARETQALRSTEALAQGAAAPQVARMAGGSPTEARELRAAQKIRDSRSTVTARVCAQWERVVATREVARLGL
jgi:serine/threonine protein kinase